MLWEALALDPLPPCFGEGRIKPAFAKRGKAQPRSWRQFGFQASGEDYPTVAPSILTSKLDSLAGPVKTLKDSEVQEVPGANPSPTPPTGTS